MRRTLLAAAILTLGTGAAHAQNWMYQTGPGGTPPAMYNTPYAPQNNIPSPYYSAPTPQSQYMPPPPNLAPPYIPMIDNPPSRSRCPYGVQC